jgi:uncharacterized protein (DUF1501 family)
MLSRRQFLTRSLQGASLLSLGTVVPGFVANTARAAEAGKDTVLVVIEMNGGNDGLNTVIPYADDLYYKARPSLAFKKDQVVRVDDHVGLHPAMRSFDQLLQKGALAIVQGVGYPNPDRSHFESMDIWQSADPRRKTGSGWIGRGAPSLRDKNGGVPVMQIGPSRLPMALQGSPGDVVSINNRQPYRLELGGGALDRLKARRKLLEDLAQPDKDADDVGMLDFVKRREVQTLATIDRLQEVLTGTRDLSRDQLVFDNGRFVPINTLGQKLQLIARLIEKGFGTRVFYVMIDGFDTHSAQADQHRKLLAEVADGITQMFQTLEASGHAKRVLAMTFSEFGRRVNENGSKGTDHGSGSCLFVAGPALSKPGAIGEHPSLQDLDSGDLRFHTDFRRVYATLLDCWLGADSQAVLFNKFAHVEQLKPKG